MQIVKLHAKSSEYVKTSHIIKLVFIKHKILISGQLGINVSTLITPEGKGFPCIYLMTKRPQS